MREDVVQDGWIRFAARLKSNRMFSADPYVVRLCLSFHRTPF